MKSLGVMLMNLSLLAMLGACGKKNESGKSGVYSYGNPYGSGAVPPMSNINSPYSYGGMSLNQVMAQNACRNGYGGMQMPGQYQQQPYANQRIPLHIPLTNFPTVIPPNDIYVGVTSWGDVAALVGQAPASLPSLSDTCVPRAFSPSGQGQLMGVKIGAYSKCLFKPMTAATIVFPGGGLAEFRWLDGGSSIGQRFTFCSM